MEKLSNYKSLIYFEAFFFIILGTAAITLPQIFTIGIELLIGSLFLIGGIIQIVRLFQAWNAPGKYGTLFSSIVNLGLGSLLLFYPILGVISLTFLLIGYFIADGLSKIYFAFQLRGYDKWGFVALSGIISLILAGIILSGLPGTAIWSLGLLIGINMLFFGFSLLCLTSSLPKE